MTYSVLKVPLNPNQPANQHALYAASQMPERIRRAAEDIIVAPFSVLHIIGFLCNDYFTVFHFWVTVCKMVRPMLSDRCPVLSVCL